MAKWGRGFLFIWIGLLASFGSADVMPIQATSPSEFSSNTADRLGRVPATVTWKAVPDAAYYFLLLSKHSDFEEGKVFRTVRSKQHLMIYPDIPYYWSVQAFAEDGGRLPFETFKPHVVTGRYLGVRPMASDLMVSDEPVERNVASTEQRPDEMEQTGALSKYDYGGRRVNNDGSESSIETKESSQKEIVVRVVESYPKWLQRNKFWMSTEAGLFQFSQNHTVLTDIEASGLMFPSFGLNYQTRDFWNHVSAKVYFRNTIGSFETKNTSITLIDNDFQFIQYGLVGQWSMNFTKRLQWMPYAGLERQSNPYFLQISPTSITVKDMENTNLVVGNRLTFVPNSRWKHHIDLGYYNSLNGKTEDLSSTTVSGQMYEVQLGMTRQFTKNGFFAGGAVRANLRDYTEDVVTQTNQASNGKRDTTYYALEFNAGILF